MMIEKKVLYLGTDPSNYPEPVTHYPVIRIFPRAFTLLQQSFEDILIYTHLILTSKNAVTVLMEALKFFHVDLSAMQYKQWVCIGTSTAGALQQFGMKNFLIAREETQEGVVQLLETLDLKEAYLFYPRSAKARPILSSYLKKRDLKIHVCDLYDTHTHGSNPLPVLTQFDEVVFTSPSTVKAFFELFSEIPSTLKLTPIGPITTRFLESYGN